MAVRTQEWTPDTLPGVTFVQQYDDTDFEGTLTCIEVKDRRSQADLDDPTTPGFMGTANAAAAAALHTAHLDNNKFKNTDLVPAMIAAVHADDVGPDPGGNSGLRNLPRFKTDENNELQLVEWDAIHPSSFGLAQAAIASAKANRASSLTRKS